MAINFLTPDDAADQYLVRLKALKPEVDTKQTDSDWWVRSRVVGGVASGIYADQRKISDDAFPQSARREALEKHLFLYFGEGFKQAQQSVGDVGVTGTPGTVVAVNLEFLYEPNGNTYQANEAMTVSDVIAPGVASGVVHVTSVSAGQSQNLLSGAPLKVSSPPTGLNSAAISLTNLSDGRDIESNDEASARILTRVRNPISGGTKSDYEQWAVEASDSVVEANAIRWLYGPGTVGVVFTAGTTDIDQALNNGDPVVRIPSDALVDIVQAYLDAKNPLTDCVHTLKPTAKEVDVTVRVRFVDGDLDTIPATQLTGQTLTQRELVQREVSRAIYKTPPGGRRFGSTGFVVCSEIEEVIDSNLSAFPYTEGAISQILIDRQVEDLSASGPNLNILETEIAEPGTITVVEF